MTPLITLTTRAIAPLALLISMTHLVGADHSPGDGFTAGIISAVGLTLQYVSFGYREARRIFRRVRFEYLLATGFTIALLASISPLLDGQPLLAVQETRFEVPLAGVVRLTRAMVFDVGIYLVVLGGAMTVVDSLGRAIE